ncbi:DUF3168 domain-containing protein [Roseicitreum antarcticum]|uniref:DUF3168 domain-containing protein n=1 Tax=Roseicitreum antarcticum TaxID=564137 RepID=A0A1H2WE04_9RHOB|nr:DUF3168 domain-containing protein [Roseicitreum antarcticum]SDW78259.1 Protein of unknown function [Roseicitreum antarcticum]
MEEAILALLAGSAPVIAMVPADRINWGEHPQGAGDPYITMMTVGDAEGLVMSGPDGLSEGRIQIDCYAPTYAQAKQISRAVRAVLHGHRGGGLRLVTHVATRDSREGGSNEAERLFRVSMDFTTAWRE